MKLKTSLVMLMLISYGQVFSQTVKQFAGIQNETDPNTKFNNTTCAKADAYFYSPEGLMFDKNNNLWITENNKIRLLYSDNFYNRAGGIGDGDMSQSYVNNTGLQSRFYNPTGIVMDDAGAFYIVDSKNHAIRKMDKFVNTGNQQVVSTFAGALPDANKFGTPGSNNGTGTNATFNEPKGIVRDASGNFYVTEFNNFVVRKITSSGVVSTLAGNITKQGTKDGTGSGAEFGGPYGIAILDANNLIVSDYDNGTIRKVHMTTGATTTIAGSAGDNRIVDGAIASARFLNPRGLAVVDGKIYVCDNSTLRVIDLNAGTVGTFAGSKDQSGNTDGDGANARFGMLGGITYDGRITLYVSDIYYNVIKTVTINNLAPTVDFSATKTSVLINEVTTFNNTSTGKPATRLKWTITPSSYSITSGNDSTAPIGVKFLVAGFYSVELKVTNFYGTGNKVKGSYISVSTTGISKIDEQPVLSVFPNPFDSRFTLESLNGKAPIQGFEVLDLTGKVILKKTCQNSLSEEIDMEASGPGFYFLRVFTSSGVNTMRLEKI